MIRFKDLCDKGLVAGKRVFIRADLNVPLDAQGMITEDTRIRASLPCNQMALQAGAAVMVTSHLGRPSEGVLTPQDSLLVVAKKMEELLGVSVSLRKDWLQSVSVNTGEVVLLENCRVNVGEKKNDPVLAKKIASLCDIYVNDAFGTAHRAEATTYGVAEYSHIACAGPLLSAEVDAITQALAQPKRPLAAIVAGSIVPNPRATCKIPAVGWNVQEKLPSGAKAHDFIGHFAARLKSCPDAYLQIEDNFARCSICKINPQEPSLKK